MRRWPSAALFPARSRPGRRPADPGAGLTSRPHPQKPGPRAGAASQQMRLRRGQSARAMAAPGAAGTPRDAADSSLRGGRAGGRAARAARECGARRRPVLASGRGDLCAPPPTARRADPGPRQPRRARSPAPAAPACLRDPSRLPGPPAPPALRGSSPSRRRALLSPRSLSLPGAAPPVGAPPSSLRVLWVSAWRDS